jgi:hypothetical protein
MGYRNPIDPYVAMLKQSERKAIGYGLLALFLLIMAYVATGIGGDGAGQFSAVVERVQSMMALFLLCGSGLSILAAIWFIGRYAYFVKWPERFE